MSSGSQIYLVGLDFRDGGRGRRGWAERERDSFLPNFGFDDLLSLSVVLHKEMQNPAKLCVKAPPSALAGNESQIKVSPHVFYVSDITRVSARFLSPFVPAAGRPD